jgi:protein-S-isoprenylcysteine O-methyltransferase Ste14
MAAQVLPANRLPRQRTMLNRVEKLLVVRRVPISIAIFATLLVVDIFVRGVRPRNVLDFTDPFVVGGELLIYLGLVIRAWAAGTLHKDRQLTTTGPYRLVRNPLYIGSFFMMFGFCALIGDSVMLWVLLGPFVLMYWLNVRKEERYLGRLFGDQWTQFAARVPRFIPRRLVVPKFSEWSLAQWRRNREYEALLGSLLALALLLVWRMVAGG